MNHRSSSRGWIALLLLASACDGARPVDVDAGIDAGGDPACACDVSATCDMGCACDPSCTSGACTETCEFSDDGECDDAGEGAITAACAYGTDCLDCGAREACAGAGDCASGARCQAGACVVDCAPSCAGRACGDDGCGGSCGSCDAGEECVSGACEACACDTTGACDASCDACDPDCCVSTHPDTVPSASVRGDVTTEGAVTESTASLRIAQYEITVAQSEVTEDGLAVRAQSTTSDCEITRPLPPACNDVSVNVTDGLGVHSEIVITTYEDASSDACAEWLRGLVTESFDLRCTRGFLEWRLACDPARVIQAEITDSWEMTIHH